MAAVATRASQVNLQAAGTSSDGVPRSSQLMLLVAYAPPQTKYAAESQSVLLAASAAQEENVTTRVSQTSLLAAFGTGVPGTQKSAAWSFILDGHRFYVLPLGPEGDWAYDTTTKEWSKLRSTGFPGLNFTHGTMWGVRIIGGDSLYTYLYELDPNQPFDEGWRTIEHMVTGGISTRSRDVIGVQNFTMVASTADLGQVDQEISLAFSDDNGITWSEEFPLVLSGSSTESLLWSALGSFQSPGRIFRLTDYAGPIRIDGANVELTASVDEEDE